MHIDILSPGVLSGGFRMTVNPNPYPGACFRVILASFKPGSSGMSIPAGRGMRLASVSTKGI